MRLSRNVKASPSEVVSGVTSEGKPRDSLGGRFSALQILFDHWPERGIVIREGKAIHGLCLASLCLPVSPRSTTSVDGPVSCQNLPPAYVRARGW